jgi:serine O-acetyltransferase
VNGIPESAAELRQTLGADFARNPVAGQRITLLIFRCGQFCNASCGLGARALRPLVLIADRLYLRTLLGTELPTTLRCGAGLALPHAGRGVVIHENASIGENSMVFHRVTIGRHGGPGAPQLADNVTVGTGAVVLGAITIGSHASVGANSVVTRDVEPWTSVGGVPARVINVREGSAADATA